MQTRVMVKKYGIIYLKVIATLLMYKLDQLFSIATQAADANETKPSAFGERIVPLIDAELKKKFEKAAAAKEKGKKVSVDAVKVWVAAFQVNPV